MSAARRAGIGALSTFMLVSGAALASPAGATTATVPSRPAAQTLTAPATPAAPGLIAATPFKGKSATQIKKISAGVAAKATAVRVTGKEPDKTYGSVAFDVRIGAKSASGTLTVSKPKPGKMRVIRVGNTVYVNGDAGIWGKDAAPGGRLHNKWIKINRTDKNYLTVARFTTIKAWSTNVSKLNVSKRYTGQKVGGTPTVRLYQPGKKGGNFYVAARGPAYPLLVATTDKKTRVSFSLWNKVVSFSAPPASATLG